MKTDQEAWNLTTSLEIDYICHRLHSFTNIHSCNCVCSVVKRIVVALFYAQVMSLAIYGHVNPRESFLKYET